MNLFYMNIDNIRKPEDVITHTQINKLRRQFQSSNINIILGAGFSYGVVGLLENIEEELYNAEYTNKDQLKVIDLKKKFFKQCILPLIDQTKVRIGESDRVRFISLLGRILENRQSSILHKIVNLYTTNYDLLLENALEKSHFDYVDGFSGKLKPVFSTANYGLLYSRQTSVSSMTSEIVTFNLYKLHGSLNWQLDNDDIIACDHVTKIKHINSVIDDKNAFIEEYSKLSIVNPTKAKLNETVLDVNYYDQLRMFSNEMEKNNTILLSFGFSFNDEHIRQMTFRFLKGNPTLNLIVLSFNEDSLEKYRKYFDTFSNVTVVQLISNVKENEKSDKLRNENFTLEHVNSILEEIYNGTK